MAEALQLEVRIGRDKYLTHIQQGPHQLRADEPVSLGGQDTAPEPTALLLAGLGACTAITLRMYADHKQLPIEAIHVQLSLSSYREGGVQHTQITRQISFEGDVPPELHERLLRVAENCPTHKLLTGEIQIETRLAAE